MKIKSKLNSNLTGQLTVQRLITAECMPLRSLVLRSGQAYDQCSFKEDEDESTFHLGVRLNLQNELKIISVGTFIRNSLPQFPLHKNSYQLRGMATDPNNRGIGAGQLLLQKAESALKEKQSELIWFNAREKAFPFYEKSGYVEVDGIITVSEFGPHKIMYKELR